MSIVSKIMSTTYPTLKPTSKINEAVRLFQNFGGLLIPVVDKEKRLISALSLDHILSYMISRTNLQSNISTLQISKNSPTCNEDDLIREALKKMDKYSSSALVVLSGGKYRGVITKHDILSFYAKHEEEENVDWDKMIFQSNAFEGGVDIIINALEVFEIGIVLHKNDMFIPMNSTIKQIKRVTKADLSQFNISEFEQKQVEIKSPQKHSYYFHIKKIELKQNVYALFIQEITNRIRDEKLLISKNTELEKLSHTLESQAHKLEAYTQSLDEMNKELKRSNNELGQFAYAASHDLKSPLRAIRNLAEWIEEDLDQSTDENTLSNLRFMINRIDRMERLLSDLLEYAQVTGENHNITLVNSEEVVNDIIQLLHIPESFEIKINSPLPEFITKRTPLHQVIRNLIHNAIKHNNKESGLIEIWAKEWENQCQFFVKDNGPGIDEKNYTSIFDMFHTLKSKDEVEGTGMGLALVQKLVSINGGQVDVHSIVERETTFSFTWKKIQQDNTEE